MNDNRISGPERHVLCMKWGSKYGPEYVNRLHAMVRRHLRSAFRFVCLTDDPRGISPDVHCLPIPSLDLPPGIPERGWTKLVTFSADLHGLHGTALFLDLDVVIVGSLERFIGMLVEHHAGALPAWLAPVQVAVLNISEGQADYAAEVAKTLRNQGFRVALDLHNEKITYKIRKHSLQKLPYIVVVGDKEKEAGAVAVRARGNIDLGAMSVEAFSQKIADDISHKR